MDCEARFYRERARSHLDPAGLAAVTDHHIDAAYEFLRAASSVYGWWAPTPLAAGIARLIAENVPLDWALAWLRDNRTFRLVIHVDDQDVLQRRWDHPS